MKYGIKIKAVIAAAKKAGADTLRLGPGFVSDGRVAVATFALEGGSIIPKHDGKENGPAANGTKENDTAREELANSFLASIGGADALKGLKHGGGVLGYGARCIYQIPARFAAFRYTGQIIEGRGKHAPDICIFECIADSGAAARTWTEDKAAAVRATFDTSTAEGREKCAFAVLDAEKAVHEEAAHHEAMALEPEQPMTGAPGAVRLIGIARPYREAFGLEIVYMDEDQELAPCWSALPVNVDENGEKRAAGFIPAPDDYPPVLVMPYRVNADNLRHWYR